MKRNMVRTMTAVAALALPGVALAHDFAPRSGGSWFGPGFMGMHDETFGPGMMMGPGFGMMNGPGFGMMTGPGFGMMMGPGMMMGHEDFDANGDGRVTFEEMEQGMEDLQAEFDADDNGTLSIEEFETLYTEMMRDHMVDIFQDLDEDGDGEVTLDEMHEPARMYERMRRYWSDDGRPGRMMDDSPMMDDD